MQGGIAARSKRGAIGDTWWSQRFIALLESFDVGSRLQRGRSYARRGQVAELEVEPGVVLARVAYYILAERFDEDPFLIFAWRGRDKDELLGGLRSRRGGPPRRAAPHAAAGPQAVPLAEQLDSFWRSGPALAELRVSPRASEVPDALLRELGPAPVELGDGRNLDELLATAYATLAEQAERAALD